MALLEAFTSDLPSDIAPWSPPRSNITSDDISVTASHATSDEMLNNENSSLRERVSELERKVMEQEDELVCLRSSMADVLRRLADLEKAPPAAYTSNSKTPSYARPTSRTNGTFTGGLTPKGMSRSVTNLRRHVPFSAEQRTISPSPNRRNNESNDKTPTHNGSNSMTLEEANRHTSPHRQRLYRRGAPPPNASRSTPLTTRASPMRKWVSSQEVTGATAALSHGGGSFLAIAKSPVTPKEGDLRNKRFSSTASLTSTYSTRSLHTISAVREPQYFPETGMLQLFLRGRPISLYAPTGVNEGFDISQPNDPPKQQLKLEWIYGYRGRDCRSNLYMMPTGEMVYFVAAVVILHNHEENSQRHYTAHTDDIKW